MTNRLYYGDNLDVLRRYIADESVDLVYLDPPFNSNANYNILFRSPKGTAADSQIEAFEDTWHYGPEAAQAFHEVMTSGNTDVANLLRSMQEFLGQNDMMAYLSMMAVRLIELHRVLKPTGSLYLHCDPTASHYLKLLLDGVFGPDRCLNEIVWKRTHAHGSAKRYGPVHDVLFFYAKSEFHLWTSLRGTHDPEYLRKNFKGVDEVTGRRYQPITLTGAGIRAGESGQAWRGINPTETGRHWALPRDVLASIGVTSGSVQDRLDALDAANRIYWPRKAGGRPRLKWFADDLEGTALPDIWTDIPPISSHSKERLGYPTQKPLALLERIIAASSNPNDVILDPFCGCGTAVHAAEKLGRQWLGIDITYLAIGLIERRLQEAFPAIDFEVVGEPKGKDDAEHLAATEPHQFQYWITQKIGGQPYQGGRKGADRGIDGYIYYSATTETDTGSAKQQTRAAIISVKAGQNVGVAMVRDLKGVMDREKADIGIFVCVVAPSRQMEQEAAAAGVWTDPGTRIDYPRLQIFTLAELFIGRQPRVPLLDRQAGFRRARREDTVDQGSLL